MFQILVGIVFLLKTPFPSLQKAVNRALSYKRLQHAAMNREAAINSLTVNITASYTHAYWIDPNGKVFQVRGENEDEIIKSLNRSDTDTHSAWILRNLDMLQKDYGIDTKSLSGTSRSLVELGWTRIGDAYGKLIGVLM